MRSSKSRQRSKSNRPRTLGNITNRVFDSSGPEGKVRGTPQQIIDKYNQLSRDAQLSNDRVNAENYLQHAEHYTRMLAEATREMQAEQDQRRQNEQQNNQGNNHQRDYAQRDRGGDQQPDLRDDRHDGGRDDNGRDDRTENRGDTRRDDRNENRPDNRNDNRRDAPRDDRNDRRNRHVKRNDDTSPAQVIDSKTGEDDSGLVETPESRRPRQHRAPRQKPEGEVAHAPEVKPVESAPSPKPKPQPKPKAESGDMFSAENLAEPAAEKPRKPRAPRKPKPETGTGNEAAE